MSRPQAYAQQEGYRYQILCRNPSYGRAWEHCDYAADRQERRYLLDNYRMAYGAGWQFKTIILPCRYWPKQQLAFRRRTRRAPNGRRWCRCATAKVTNRPGSLTRGAALCGAPLLQGE